MPSPGRQRRFRELPCRGKWIEKKSGKFWAVEWGNGFGPLHAKDTPLKVCLLPLPRGPGYFFPFCSKTSAALVNQSPNKNSILPWSQAAAMAGSMGSLAKTSKPCWAASSSEWLSPKTCNPCHCRDGGNRTYFPPGPQWGYPLVWPFYGLGDNFGYQFLGGCDHNDAIGGSGLKDGEGTSPVRGHIEKR